MGFDTGCGAAYRLTGEGVDAVRPLPFAPRPFADEALGSWIGRVAGRYRMNVTQLDTDYELRLGLTSGLFWLMPAALSPVTLGVPLISVQ